jgi:hypothetical protein
MLIYVSSASYMMSNQELSSLLTKARENNHALNVTGMLLYSSGNFVQPLEGTRASLNEIYAKIYKDPRHYNIIKLFDREINQREFAEWSMGFRNLSGVPLTDLPGYSAIFEDELTYQAMVDHPGIAHSILTYFRDTMR